MRKPSVIFINRVYAPSRGASGRVLRDLAQGFAADGWHVRVITTGVKAICERDGKVEVIRVRGAQKPSGAFSYGWLLLKLMVAALRQPSCDLVVTLSDPPLLGCVGGILKRFKGARHIHWCHDIYPDLFPALGVKFPALIMRFMTWLSVGAINGADRVIVIGRCMAQYFKDKNWAKNKISMIPNWPDQQLYQDGESDTEAAPAHRGLAPEKIWYSGAKPFEDQLKSDQKFRVLYAGNIGLAHPLETVLIAAEILRSENPEIEFVFVGDGPRFDKLATERIRRELNNVRFLPYQPLKHLRRMMESGDLHLVSLKEEAASMAVPSKIYSAFAARRPCIFIGPAQSEAALAIDEFKAGAVAPQGDGRGLADVIKKYRHDGEVWFAAQKGAVAAGQVFLPSASIAAWIERAWDVVVGIDGIERRVRPENIESATPPKEVETQAPDMVEQIEKEKEVA